MLQHTELTLQHTATHTYMAKVEGRKEQLLATNPHDTLSIASTVAVCVAVCCSVLQRELQCVVMCCSVLAIGNQSA